MQFVNAGVNGDLAWNVLQRLDGIASCQPDVVTLLVGTNDVNASVSQWNTTMYRWIKGLPQPPTVEFYGECIDAILTRLRTETSARLAVLEIPMMGEDLHSEINQHVVAYNARLREIAATHDVVCLPLHCHLAQMLPPGHRPPPFTGRITEMQIARLPCLPRRGTQPDRSVGRGLAVTSDHVHLSNSAADVVAELIAAFVMSQDPI